MVAGQQVYPSTQTYRDRLGLAADDAFAYNSIYARTQRSDVWGRLTDDAKVRTSTRSTGPGSGYAEGQSCGRYSWKSSGFDSNTTPPVYTQGTFKAGHIQDGVPIEELHTSTAMRYKQKQPLAFMAAIRPDTETTNQAMRMLGTYDSDRAHAERLRIFIPQVCPGGTLPYHSDVRTGGYGMMPTLPRRGMGQTLADGNNLK